MSNHVIAATALVILGTAASAADHPRLMFEAKDVPALRTKVTKEPWKSVYARIKTGFPGEVRTQGKLSITGHWLLNEAFIALIDNDAKRSAEAAQALLALVNDGGFLANDKDLSRATRLRCAGMAFDLLAPAMSVADCSVVSGKLKALVDSIDQNPGPGWPPVPANNHHAIVWGASVIAHLVQDETPFPAPAAKPAFDRLLRHFTMKYGSDASKRPGWDPEGVTYLHYSIAGAWPAVLAGKRLLGRDLYAEAPGFANAAWVGMLQSVAMPYRMEIAGKAVAQLGLHGDFSDEHNAFANDVGPMGGANAAFLFSPPATHPGIQFMYDRLVGAKGDQSYDAWRNAGILGVLALPEGITAKDPAEVPGLGRTWIDREWGLVVFRKSFDGADDIVASHLAKLRDPTTNLHQGVDCNNFRILGLGMQWIVGPGGPMHKVDQYPSASAPGTSTVFPGVPSGAGANSRATGSLLKAETLPDGGGWTAIKGSSVGTTDHVRRFVVDYGAASGAAATFVVADSSANGKTWRMHVPRIGKVATGTGSFTVTAPNGAIMTGTVLWPKSAAITTAPVTQVGDKNMGTFRWTDGVSEAAGTAIDIAGTDGKFLVVMTLTPKGVKTPAATGSGDGIDQQITVGKLTLGLSGTAGGAGELTRSGGR